MITWLRYVIHSQVSAYERLGWRPLNALAGTHHGVHAVMMEWVGDGTPPMPEGEKLDEA